VALNWHLKEFVNNFTEFDSRDRFVIIVYYKDLS